MDPKARLDEFLQRNLRSSDETLAQGQDEAGVVPGSQSHDPTRLGTKQKVVALSEAVDGLGRTSHGALRGYRSWFWLLIFIDLLVTAAFLVLLFSLRREADLVVIEAGGRSRYLCYVGASLAFGMASVWLGYLSPDDRTARLGYLALLSESLCLFSTSLRNSAHRFHGFPFYVFQCIWLFDGLNWPIAYQYFLSEFSDVLPLVRGQRGLAALYSIGLAIAGARLCLEAGWLQAVGSWIYIFDFFYIAAPLLLSCMIAVNYRAAKRLTVVNAERKWFFVFSILGISLYGLARIIQLVARLDGLLTPNRTSTYQAVELFTVVMILGIALASTEGIARREWFGIRINQVFFFRLLYASVALVLGIFLYEARGRKFLFVAALIVFFLFCTYRDVIQRLFSGNADTEMLVCPSCGTVYPLGVAICKKDEAELIVEQIPRIMYSGTGNYALKRKLGAGEAGQVYEALHFETNSTRAIKVIGLAVTNDRRRFQREAKLLQVLDNPGIVKVYEFFELRNYGIIVMEFVEGLPLDKVFRYTSYHFGDIADWFVQICDAVSAAHTFGVIHRDLKPSNVLLARDETGNPLIKLSDFGIAKEADQPAASHTLTRSPGTPVYASPEQYSSLGGVDHRTDIYSLGVMLFECLSGTLPYRSTLGSALHQAKLTNDVNFDRGHLLDPRLLEIIRRCLETEPTRRFQTVLSLKEDLIPVLESLRPA